MKNIIRNILAIAAVVTLATGCKGFLDEVDQSKFIASTADHFSSVLLGEFNESYAPFYNVQWMTDEVRDGVSVSNNNVGREERRPFFCWQRDIEKNMTDFSRIDQSSYWAYCYKIIAICNNIFENIDGVDEEKPGEKAFVLAEAQFTAALMYFNLVNLYAEPYRPETASQTMGVPVVEGTGIEHSYDRAMLDETYDKIVSLLNSSLENIKASGLNYKSYHKISDEAVRIVLSRVYLFMQDYDKVISTLDPIMEHASLKQFSKNDEYTWDEGCNEVIYTYGLYTYNRFKDYAESYYFNVAEELFNLYDEDDARRDHWFKYSSDPDTGEKIVTTQKGTVSDRLGQMVVRYGEAYLNIAEAYAMKNDVSTASSYLSKFVKSRHESRAVIELPTAQKDFVKYVFDERFREFCFEDHCRWFDLRRMNESDRPVIVHQFKVMQETTLVAKERYTLLQNDPNYTLSLPYQEKDNNPMIMDYDRFDKVPF